MTDKSTVLTPGSTIGILGGGQLGRMLALAAARLGLKSHIYCPDPQSPAFDVTPANLITGIITPKGIFKPRELWANRKRLGAA